MRLYLVRRTRGFIKENYAKADEDTGRKYLESSRHKLIAATRTYPFGRDSWGYHAVGFCWLNLIAPLLINGLRFKPRYSQSRCNLNSPTSSPP